MRSSWRLGVLAVTLLLAGATASQVSAQECERPNVPARVLHPVMPDMPRMAQLQGISGMVRVEVSLDADSHIVALKIYSSANAMLNNAALWAARQSTYQTAVVNCKPIATDVLFSVEFDSAGPRGALSQTPVPTPTPSGCAYPNVAAAVLHAATPTLPPLAAQQGIGGTVQLKISLDADSRVVAASIYASPSALLNEAALAAARASTFRTLVVNCQPVARDFLYMVFFERSAQTPAPMPTGTVPPRPTPPR
jgi:TonB family protein